MFADSRLKGVAKDVALYLLVIFMAGYTTRSLVDLYMGQNQESSKKAILRKQEKGVSPLFKSESEIATELAFLQSVKPLPLGSGKLFASGSTYFLQVIPDPEYLKMHEKNFD